MVIYELVRRFDRLRLDMKNKPDPEAFVETMEGLAFGKGCADPEPGAAWPKEGRVEPLKET